jgi:hypothetical protein
MTLHTHIHTRTFFLGAPSNSQGVRGGGDRHQWRTDSQTPPRTARKLRFNPAVWAGLRLGAQNSAWARKTVWPPPWDRPLAPPHYTKSDL